MLLGVRYNQTLEVVESDATMETKPPSSVKKSLFVRDALKIDYVHKENLYVDFNRDRLLSEMLSTQGPEIIVADINNNGNEDIFVGGYKGNLPTILIGNKKVLSSDPIKNLKQMELQRTRKPVF